jgi:hypothetical protein
MPDFEQDGSEEQGTGAAGTLTKSNAADRAAISEALERAIPLDGLDPHDHQALVGVDHWQDIKLKKTYAKWLLRLVALQLFITDAVFVAYAWAGRQWELDTSVIQVWLGSTLVELIGVALVVTRYLFPRRDKSPDGP